MSLQNFNSNIILPSYNDGFFNVYEIKSNDLVTYPDEFLIDLKKTVFFTEISVTDTQKISASDRKINIIKKIRISQNKFLNPNHVLKINEIYYKIFNTFHFTNQDGFPETDISLQKYDREIKIKEEQEK